jgi:hypothetical protein
MTFADFDSYEDECISEEMLARLHNATEESVLALVASFRANDRARLALYCYRKMHLRPIGLAIGSSCNLTILESELGPGLGRAIFDQSRDRPEESKPGYRVRRSITLASSAGRTFPPPIGCDELSELDDNNLEVPTFVG